MTRSNTRSYGAGSPIGKYAPATAIFTNALPTSRIYNSCQLGYSKTTGQAYIWTPSDGWQQIATGGTGGVLTVPNGGTGDSTLTAHGVLLGEGTSAIAASAAGTAGQAFVSGGASTDGAYGVTGVNGGGTGVATIAGLTYGNGTSAFTGIVPTVTSGSVGSPQILNNRAGNITFTGISIAAGGNATLTNTNSFITSGSTQILWSMSGATAGAALTMASVTSGSGTVDYVVTNGTGATTSTANITIQFLILN